MKRRGNSRSNEEARVTVGAAEEGEQDSKKRSKKKYKRKQKEDKE